MAVKPKKLGEEAAKSTTAVNTLVGFRKSEVIKSLGLLAGYAAKQPKPFAKHLKNYATEMLDIATGTSELAPDKRDRRFQDPTWSKNPFYKRGMQSWLAMRRELNGWIDDSRIHPADQARSKFITDLIVDALAPTNTLLGNPAAMKRLFETGGLSLAKGMKNVLIMIYAIMAACQAKWIRPRLKLAKILPRPKALLCINARCLN